ncbi:MAG: hypothetical protein QXP81_10855 [Nitrososphaerota archaeon]
MKREYTLLQVGRPDIISRIASVEPDIVSRAIKLGVIKNPEEARVRTLDARDLGKTVAYFQHTFAAANTMEKYVDAYEVKGKVICIFGAAFTSDLQNLVNIRFGKGVPVRPVFETGLVDAAYVQQEPKVLFSEDVWVEPGEKLTIELESRAIGAENFVLMGLVCEKA